MTIVESIILGAVQGLTEFLPVSSSGHLQIAKALLGVEIEESYGKLLCTIKDKLKGAKITLTFPSVGATENAILLASVSEGTTTIINAAREPEIIDLVNFLKL